MLSGWWRALNQIVALVRASPLGLLSPLRWSPELEEHSVMQVDSAPVVEPAEKAATAAPSGEAEAASRKEPDTPVIQFKGANEQETPRLAFRQPS